MLRPDVRQPRASRPTLIVIGSPQVFGAERRLLKLAAALVEQGAPVMLLINSTLLARYRTAEPTRKLVEQIDRAGALSALPDSLGVLFSMRRPLQGLIRLLTWPLPHLVLKARVLAFPLALVGRDCVVEVTSQEIAGRITAGWPRALIRRTRWVCVSKTVRNDFLARIEARFGAEFARGVRSFHYRQPFQSFEMASEGVPPAKEKIILSASRFLGRKNVLLLARSAARALERLPGWKIVILGAGAEEDAIRDALKPLIETGRAEITYTDKPEPYYARSSVYVSLIEPDNFPSQAILQAMFHGNALLLSDTGDSSVFLDPLAPGGRLVEPVESAVEDALVGMCSDADELRRMGERSSAWLNVAFSPEQYLEQFYAGRSDVHGGD